MGNKSDEIESLIKINEELRALVEPKENVTGKARSNKALLAAFIFGKSYRTHSAVVSLCRQGFGEDAFTLTRTLFEMMINFAYITQINTDARLLRYVEHEIVSRKKLMNYIKTQSDLNKQFEESLVAKGDDFKNFIQNLDSEYQRLLKKYGKSYKKHWSGADMAQMAEKVGRKDTYSTVYRLQCSHSHADLSGISSNTNSNEDGLVLDIEASPRWVCETLVVAFDCFFHIVSEVNAQLEWDLDQDLKSIENRYVDTVRKTT